MKAALLNTANDLGNPGQISNTDGAISMPCGLFNLLKDNHFYIGLIDNGGTNTALTIPVEGETGKNHGLLAGPGKRPRWREGIGQRPRPARVRTRQGYIEAACFEQRLPILTSSPRPPRARRNHLSNMEQVSIADPAPGDYLVQISGFEVPQGPSRYFLVYEFLTDEVQFTYPIGGEGMVPGEKELVHWDAFGKTGEDFPSSFQQTAARQAILSPRLPPRREHFEWTVPSAVSGNCLFRIKRDGKEFKTPAPFTIITQPDTLLIDKVCPTKSQPYMACRRGRRPIRRFHARPNAHGQHRHDGRDVAYFSYQRPIG